MICNDAFGAGWLNIAATAPAAQSQTDEFLGLARSLLPTIFRMAIANGPVRSRCTSKHVNLCRGR